MEEPIRKKLVAEDMETEVWIKGYSKDSQSSLEWTEIINKPFDSININSFVLTDGNMAVRTINDAIQDNTLPITSAGVYTIVGNIQALLDLI